MSTNTEILKTFYERVWIAGKLEEAAGFFDLDAEATGLMPDLAVTGAEFAEFVGPMLEMLTVNSITFGKAVEQGDWVAIMAGFDATVTMTGHTISSSGMLMARIENGRIAEAYNCIDFLSLFEKLHLVPENALALGMAGQRLR